MLTVSCKIQKFHSMDDALFFSMNDRNANIGTYDACVRSTVQMVFEVAAFKQYYFQEHNKKLTLSELAKLWESRVRDTGSALQEKVGLSWIEAGIKVHDRLLKEPMHYEIIMDLQNTYSKSSCLNSIKNLEAIAMKGKTAEERLWILECVQDYLRSGFSNSEFANRLLNSSRSGGGPAGMLDMFISKLQIRDYFIDRWCPDKGFDGQSLQMLREVRDLKEFRQKCGGAWAASTADVSWQGCRMESERRAVAFLKDNVFGSKNDCSLRQIIRGVTVPAEILEKNPYTEQLERIEEAIQDMKVDLNTKESVQSQLGQEAEDEETSKLTELLAHDLKNYNVVADNQKDELRTWLVRCREHVNHFVSFVVNDVDTVNQLSTLMGNTCLSEEMRNRKAKCMFLGIYSS